MTIEPHVQAVMLLTVTISDSNTSKVKPLSAIEWARFAIWLKDHKLEPSSLFAGDLGDQLSGWSDSKVTLPRLEMLLQRGGALAVVLEKWQRAGLWVLTRSDPDYPERLKNRLRAASSPVLFGSGNKQLLNKGGLAVIGSRNANDEDLTFTSNLGAEAAGQGYSIISGGARGVDETAMLAALEGEGTCVGILADSLLRSTSSAKFRKYIMSNDLVLLSPFNPEAGFNVGHAMARNRYIYALSDAAVVISSSPGKGGTWSGAIENLKSRWVPLWIKNTVNPNSGNPELVNRGADWLPKDIADLNVIFSEVSENRNKLSSPGDTDTVSVSIPETPSPSNENYEFYRLFLQKISAVAVSDALTSDEIAERFEIAKGQINTWLKRGVDDGVIRKLTLPVRYQWVEGVNKEQTIKEQGSLFDGNVI